MYKYQSPIFRAMQIVCAGVWAPDACGGRLVLKSIKSESRVCVCVCVYVCVRARAHALLWNMGSVDLRLANSVLSPE